MQKAGDETVGGKARSAAPVRRRCPITKDSTAFGLDGRPATLEAESASD
jgi:hypothetical protein